MTTATISDQGAPPAPLAPPTWSETILFIAWSGTGAYRGKKQEAYFSSVVWVAAWYELVCRHGEIPKDQVVTDYLNCLMFRYVAVPASPVFHYYPYRQPFWRMFCPPDAMIWPEIVEMV